MNLKRLLALLLSAMMLLSIGLVAVHGETQADTADDLWAAITAYEDARFSEQHISAATADERDYAALTDDVIALVENWNGYVPGSLVRNGDFFCWDGRDGIGYGYSPRMRRIERGENATGADPALCSDIVTVSYAARGGSPAGDDVAVFGPYYGQDDSFTDQYRNEANSIAQTLGSTCTVYQSGSATIDNIAHAMETCGVVIFDSHGTTDYANGENYTARANTSYLCLTTSAGVTSEDTAYVTGPYGQYKHAIVSGSSAYVDGTAIANHMTGDAPNSLLWMAICLGMATDGLFASLHEKGVEVVYGYSQSVTFYGDYAWEDCFWTRMKDGSDVQEAVAYMKGQVGIKDPYTSIYPAYPIVVSSEDAYPGHGNVDKAQTVYSSWTLFPQFAVEAVSNDTSLGTVEVSGSSIIATPSEGCAVVGYEVISGTATVTQNGNGFSKTRLSVRAQSDCMIRIDFAARTKVNATFITPEGTSCEGITAYSGDAIAMPTPVGMPTANAQPYAFFGWAEERVADTDARPNCLRAGEDFVIDEDSTFYALYSYAMQDGATVAPGTYPLLAFEPTDWTGEAVLTYDGQVVLSANSNATSIGTTAAAIAIDSTGVTVAEDALRNVSDAYVYVIEPAGDGYYTIRMKGDNQYLSYMSGSNKLSTAKTISEMGGKSSAYWSLGWENETPVFKNSQMPSASLCYDTGSRCFTCKRNNRGTPLTIYSIPADLLRYTTEVRTVSAVCGDANCDGKVTTADAALVLRAVIGLSRPSWRGMMNAQLSGGDTLSAADAAMILRYVVGLINTLSVAE